MTKPSGCFWMRPNGLAALVLIAAAAYFLLTEHRAHVVAALPWLILLLCPLMHVFMHRGHSHVRGHPDDHDRGAVERHDRSSRADTQRSG